MRANCAAHQRLSQRRGHTVPRQRDAYNRRRHPLAGTLHRRWSLRSNELTLSKKRNPRYSTISSSPKSAWKASSRSSRLPGSPAPRRHRGHQRPTLILAAVDQPSAVDFVDFTRPAPGDSLRKDVGRNKIDSAAEDAGPQRERGDRQTRGRPPARTFEILKEPSTVVDGTGLIPTRYSPWPLLLLGKPNVYGSIFRFEGGATVFAVRRRSLVSIGCRRLRTGPQLRRGRARLLAPSA